MYKTYDLIHDLPKIWRIVACVLILQIVGSIVGLAIGLHHNNFENSWMGGAVATPIGFIVGLFWHIKSEKETDVKAYRTIVFLGFIALLIGGMAVFFEIPRSIKEMELLESFKKLDAANVKQILVFDEYGEHLIKKITDDKTIRDFTASSIDTKGYSPNHPQYESTWYVVVDSDDRIELECDYQKGFSSTLIGIFVQKKGMSWKVYGSFTNNKLRQWFETNVESSR